jgi:hypothetical protein
MQRDLGLLAITYDGQQSTSEFCGAKTGSGYRVAWQSKDSIFVVFTNKEGESGQHIHFASPSLYWVHTGRFIEYFSKVLDA